MNESLKNRLYNKPISLLVLLDIIQKYWHSYLVIGVLFGIAFILQIIGVAIILKLFNGDLTMPFDLQDLLPKYGYEEQLIVSSFIILFASAICMFFSRKVTVQLMIKYEMACASKLMQHVGSDRMFLKNTSDTELIRLLSKDCRFGGRIVQEISNIVMPLGVTIIAIPVLFYLNFEATIIIAIAVALTLVPYGFIIRRASSISYSFEDSAKMDNMYKKEFLRNTRKTEGAKEDVPLFPHPEFRRYYQQRLIVPHYGILIGGIQVALCLSVFAFWYVVGSNASDDIGQLVLYGFVAVFALNQVRTLPKVVANYHVFLAYYRRVFVILKGIEDSGARIMTEDNLEPTQEFEDDF